MKQLTTTGIILQRTDYGEADRILVLLTPDHGKLHLLAKGVRRVKSKLAGGIELFSVSHITFLEARSGRGGLGTLISSRLIKHYGDIVKDVNRTMLGYDLIKQLHKATEDEPESEYFTLLEHAFEALNDHGVDVGLIRLWFAIQLLRIAGHSPNLQTDITGAKLHAEQRYVFSFDDMTFAIAPAGQGMQASHIKFLRLAFQGYQPRVLQQVQGGGELTAALMPLVQAMAQTHLRM